MYIDSTPSADKTELPILTVNPRRRQQIKLAIRANQHTCGKPLQAFSGCINCSERISPGNYHENSAFLPNPLDIQLPFPQPARYFRRGRWMFASTINPRD
jgi:hypothetical protein